MLPDLNWWLQQLKAGDADRSTKTREDLWPIYYQYYRNQYKANVYPKNMFFVMARQVVPRIYYRDPRISIVAKKPGIEFQALAKILERVDNALIAAMNLKLEMKRAVNASFFNSFAVLKLLFGAEFTPTPTLGGTNVPVSKKGERSEYRQGIVGNMPFIKHIPTKDFILAKDVRNFEDSFFQAQRIFRYWDDLENDSRFPMFKQFANKSVGVTPISSRDPLFQDEQGLRRLVELYEIRDRRTRKVIVFAPDVMPKDKPLIYEDDELQTSYSSPFFIYTPNIDSEHPYGVADADIILTLQEQLNDIKTLIHQHARVSLVKWLNEKNAISASEAQKLLNSDVGAIINVANARGLHPVESHHIPDSLLKQEQELMEDMRELMGFSRNSLAQFQARSHGPTATEVNAVRQAAELRIDERRDMIADLLSAIFRDIHLLIFRHWTEEQVIKVLGSDGYPVWVRFTGSMLEEGEYDIQIEPDSSVPETREVRESRASRIYAELRQDPNVDPVKLTRYRIHETPGVALDDLLRSEVAPGGSILSLDEFTQKEASLASA